MNKLITKEMSRKETTKFLSDLLVISRFSGIGKYYASEVTIDYGTKDIKRVDFMQFEPQNQLSIGGLEKGIFICYEVKSCKEDFDSGYGRNFIGEKNYIVTTMQTYRKIVNNTLLDNRHIGVLVACPRNRELVDEFENPTPLSANVNWTLKTVKQCHQDVRKRSMVELLFCMLRSGK